MKKNILTEQGNPATRRIDLMGTDEIVAAISHEDMKVARAVKKALPEIARAVVIIAGAFFKGGRLAYFGPIDEARAFFGKESMEEIVKSVNRQEEGGEGRADEFILKYAEVQHG